MRRLNNFPGGKRKRWVWGLKKGPIMNISGTFIQPITELIQSNRVFNYEYRREESNLE